MHPFPHPAKPESLNQKRDSIFFLGGARLVSHTQQKLSPKLKKVFVLDVFCILQVLIVAGSRLQSLPTSSAQSSVLRSTMLVFTS